MFLDVTNHNSSATTAKKAKIYYEKTGKNDRKVVNCAQKHTLVELLHAKNKGEKRLKNILTKVPLKLHKYIKFQLLCYTTTEHKNEKEREGKTENKTGTQQTTKNRHP